MESIFSSKTLARLLKTLLLHPEADFYQRELAAAAGGRLYSVQRELARLERAGLVERSRRGNRVYYRANRSHPAFEDLKRVFYKTVGLGDALRAALAPLSNRIRVAFLYGSIARGEEAAGSDADLMLVGDLSTREAASVLAPLGRRLGRELNPAVYPPAEFRRKARQGHPFIAEVLKNDKMFLVGTENDLAGIAGNQAPPAA